jgi:hypothetical protein
MTAPNCNFGKNRAAIQSGSGFQETEIGFRRSEIGFRRAEIGFRSAAICCRLAEFYGLTTKEYGLVTEVCIRKAVRHNKRAGGNPRWPTGFVPTMAMHIGASEPFKSGKSNLSFYKKKTTPCYQNI